MATYKETLKAAQTTGASRATDAQTMALYCAGPLQTITGAVAPALVWEGAQRAGLTTLELSRMEPHAVADLMWN